MHAFNTLPDRREDFFAVCDVLNAQPLSPGMLLMSCEGGAATCLGWFDGNVIYRNCDLPTMYR